MIAAERARPMRTHGSFTTSADRRLAGRPLSSSPCPLISLPAFPPSFRGRRIGGMDWSWLNRDLGLPSWLFRFRAYLLYFSCAIFACAAVVLLWFGEEPLIRFAMAPFCALIAAWHYYGARRNMNAADRRDCRRAPGSTFRNDSRAENSGK